MEEEAKTEIEEEEAKTKMNPKPQKGETKFSLPKAEMLSVSCKKGNTGPLNPINPEIDRTYHRLVRQSINLPFRSVADTDNDFVSTLVFVHSVQYTNFVHSIALSDSEHFEHSENYLHFENMAQPPTPPGPRERTLRELAAPDFTYDSLCIPYPNEDVSYVLKTGLIHLLPKFNGLASEDPRNHRKKFHIVCSTMKPHV
ncbi:hypothetical protein Lal_00043661 [Lupinus albus]|nr:hypothetical protein Lal_00043661 [Lupinus albus]